MFISPPSLERRDVAAQQMSSINHTHELTRGREEGGDETRDHKKAVKLNSCVCLVQSQRTSTKLSGFFFFFFTNTENSTPHFWKFTTGKKASSSSLKLYKQSCGTEKSDWSSRHSLALSSRARRAISTPVRRRAHLVCAFFFLAPLIIRIPHLEHEENFWPCYRPIVFSWDVWDFLNHFSSRGGQVFLESWIWLIGMNRGLFIDWRWTKELYTVAEGEEKKFGNKLAF